MLDRKFILENIEAVKLNCKNRNVVADVDRFVELDQARREKQQELEALNRESNAVAKQIGKCATPEEREAKKEEGRAIREKLVALEKEVKDLARRRQDPARKTRRRSAEPQGNRSRTRPHTALHSEHGAS